MKLLGILLSAILCSLVGTCQTTPDQVTQYANAAHAVVGNGLADYKTVKAVTR